MASPFAPRPERPDASPGGSVLRFPNAPEAWWRHSVVRRSGEPIYDGAPDHKTVCFVRSGWVARSRLLADGRRQIVELLLPGDHQGVDRQPRSSEESLTALGLCEVACVPMAEVRDAVSVSASLQADVAAAERRRAAIQEEWLVNLGRRDAVARMAHLFCELFTRAGRAPPLFSLPFPLTQTDLSDVLGLSVVHTNRTLQTLRRQGLVMLRNGRLSAPDFAALTAAAGISPVYLLNA